MEFVAAGALAFVTLCYLITSARLRRVTCEREAIWERFKRSVLENTDVHSL